jgi:EamA domain-containing membrane protein RarD
MVQTASYGLFRKGLKMNKAESLAFSLATSLMVTTLYSLSNGSSQTPGSLGRTMQMNAIGMGLSAVTCGLVFDF